MAGRRGNGENSIYLSGGRWHVQGFISGRRRRISRTRRGEAVAAWAELVRTTPASGLYCAGAPTAAASPRTVAQALEQWFELSQDRWRHSTRVGYRCAIDRHLTPHPADVYFGRGHTILLDRERIKRQTIQQRRLIHQQHAA